MEITMTQGATETTTETAGETSADTSTTAEAATAEATTTSEGETALGDAGKKALDAMKAKWKDADKLAKDNAAALAAIQAKLDGKEAEHAAEQKAREVESAALAKANDRILKAEVRAAAAGKLENPALALKLIDLSTLDVSEDGEVDTAAISAAIDELIKNEPYLAAQGGRKFQGSADGGARNDSTSVAQLTQADMGRMSPEQIDDAYSKGQFDGLLGRT